MKRLLASTAILLCAVVPASAQMTNAFVQAPAEGDIYASNLMGMRLYVTEGQVTDNMTVGQDQLSNGWNDIGEVNDVLVSQDGQVKAVLLDIGGFLGIGEKSVAVDMSQLHFIHDQNDPGDVFIAMQGTEDSLRNAPDFNRGDMPDMTEQPNDTAMNGTGTTPLVTDNSTAMNNNAATNGTGTTPLVTDNSTAAVTNGNNAMTDNSAATGMAPAVAPGAGAAMWNRPAMQQEGYADVQQQDLTADNLTGATVYGPDGESVGEIGDLILGQDGKISDALVDVGGFLGIGEHRVAISFDEMQVMRENNGNAFRVNISATKDQLEQRPEYTQG